MSYILQSLGLFSMLAVCVVLIWRVLGNGGASLSKTIPEVRRFTATEPTFKECRSVFVYAMLFRVFLFALGFVIFCIFIETGEKFQWNQLFDNWIKWDANAYIRISNGYTSYMENREYPTVVFFPLYPLLIKILRYIIPNAAAAGLLISAVLSSFACVYMYKLMCIDYSKATAKIAVLLMCLFPFSFYYGAIMSESTFLLTSIMTLYYARKNNWKLAGICGLCASLSRSLGVFLIVPAVIQLLEENKLFGNLKDKNTWIKTLKEGAWLLLLPLGTLIYLYINYDISGDPFYFLSLEKQFWHQTSQPFCKTIGTFWDIITTGKYKPATLLASFVPGFIVLICSYVTLMYGAKKHKTMYIAWLAVSIIVNSSMSWPLSFCRYMATAVPLYMILADECEKHEKLKLGIFISWSILFGMYFTGYLIGKQIM
ncbi:MAG: glycosyltransferase family 39 protein [Clostridia bacterium]|nr:glycosyltransferase family 39 protein [Clostridia bacterium]